MNRETSARVTRRLAIQGAATFALSAVPAATAQAQSTPVAAPELLQRWAEGWSNLGSPDGLLALVAPDIIYEDVAAGDRVEGLEAFRQLLAEAHTGIPDFHIELFSGIGNGAMAAAEYVITGTQQGALPYLAAEDRPFRLRAASIFTLAGETIQRESRYYDMLSFLNQLHALPAADVPPLGTPAADPPS